MIRSILYSTAALAAFIATAALAEDSAGMPKNVKLVYDQPLPNVPGKSMRG
ncbi:MAG: cupin domain-containing protein, partial [Mesorhizobium sp.]